MPMGIEVNMSALKLIIVEDDQDDRDIFREALADLPCEATLYTNGHSFLEQLTRGGFGTDFRVFILDMNMTSPNGLEITQRLREEQDADHWPVIVLTTSSDPKDRLACCEAGANAYITKPGLYSEWQMMLTALVEFWQWTHPEPGPQ